MNRAALIAIALCALTLSAQQAVSPDPSTFGPVPITNGVYRIDNLISAQLPFPFHLLGTVWYPDGLPAGPYPLVIILHGNHGICRRPGTKDDFGTILVPPFCGPGFEETPNHLGYDYAASRLASYGYIVASISANAVNLRANGNTERGRLVQEHLRYWAQWNSPQGGYPWDTQFSGKVDLQKVGLIGHSRGGEGVRAAYNFNRQDNSPVGIKAVFEIGPVDFGRRLNLAVPNPLFNSDDVNWTVLLPACDADVFTNEGMQVYDRTKSITDRSFPTPKSYVYVRGTNHNFYNSEWLAEDPDFNFCIDFPVVTDRPTQEAIGAVYMVGYMRTYLGGENFKGLFTGDLRPPATVTVPVDVAYTESPNNIQVIDDFTHRNAPDVNTAGGNNTSNNISFTACNDRTCREPAPGAWYHDRDLYAGKISWPGSGTGTPSIGFEVSPSAAPRNVSAFGFLALRAATAFNSRNTYAGQEFTVRLADAAGATSVGVATSTYRTLPYPTGGLARHAVLKTVRIPLAAFSGVDRTRITRIQILFDKNPTGAIFLTDVHFTQ
ncbi:MAG: hypothetical protein ACRD96_17215 [Bryobacteraceae bacterium]